MDDLPGGVFPIEARGSWERLCHDFGMLATTWTETFES